MTNTITDERMQLALNEFQQSVSTPLLSLWEKLVSFIPNFVAAIIIVTLGYFLARALAFIVGKTLTTVGFNSLGESTGLNKFLANSNLTRKEPAYLLEIIVFWIVMLTFVVSSAEALGLQQVSATLETFMFFLPKVLAGSLVLLIGLFIAQFVKNGILSIASGLQAKHALLVSHLVYGFLVVVIGALSATQLGINMELLNNIITLFFMAFAAGLALALGLGGKNIAEEALRSLLNDPADKP